VLASNDFFLLNSHNHGHDIYWSSRDCTEYGVNSLRIPRSGKRNDPGAAPSPQDVLARRVQPSAQQIVALIHEVNPTV
jgi:hypothetical protein